MEFSFSLSSIILLLGITQGLFLVFLLLGKVDNKEANRFLALLIFSYSAFLVESSLAGTEITKQYPHILGLTSGVVFLIGPFHFLYARTLISTKKEFTKTDLLHFLPFLSFYLYFLFPFYLQSGDFKITYFDQIDERGPTLELRLFSWAVLIQGVIYMVATLKLLRKHVDDIKKSFSSLEEINLSWLRRITFISMIVWVFGIIIELVQISDPVTSLQGLVPISIAFLIYTMGYLGLRQPEIFSGASGEQVADPSKYERSGLSESSARRIHQKLLALMNEQHIYRDSDLKLNQLAHELSTSSNYLSQVINQIEEQNFYDFINEYRINDVKKKMRDGKYANQTILSLAYEAGFNSKSAFNTAFKKHTDMTPSQYKNSIETKSS
jgi:AraC-like DNA-binding protein